MKLDATGNMEWQKCLGGTGNENGTSCQQTADGGFIVGGYSQSDDGDVSGNHGGGDYWIVKLTSDTVSGIALIPNNIISVYPNPVRAQLTIVINNFNEGGINLAGTTIRVYDLQGRIITLPITFTNIQAQLNTTSLPDGFYTLQITSNKTGANEVGKFVKQ